MKCLSRIEHFLRRDEKFAANNPIAIFYAMTYRLGISQGLLQEMKALVGHHILVVKDNLECFLI